MYSVSVTFIHIFAAGNGESCVNPTRSCGANAACSNGVCGCNNGYTYSSSSGSCESTSCKLCLLLPIVCYCKCKGSLIKLYLLPADNCNSPYKHTSRLVILFPYIVCIITWKSCILII